MRKQLREDMKRAQDLKNKIQEIELQRDVQQTKEDIEIHEQQYKEVRNQYKAQLHKIRQEQVGMVQVKDLSSKIKISKQRPAEK